MQTAASPDEVARVIRALLALALDGNVMAAALLLRHLLGKPSVEVDLEIELFDPDECFL